MKKIVISADTIRHMLSHLEVSRAVTLPLKVDWFPRLTEQQIFENACALVAGRPTPHPDPNIIDLRIEQ